MRRGIVAFIGALTLGTGGTARELPTSLGAIGGFVAIASLPAQQPTPRDSPQARPPGTAILRGRVYAADTGQPLRRAQVRLIGNGPPPAAQPPENRLATTDAGGRFEFTAVRAGRYAINVQKSSYVALQWGQRRPTDAGRPLDVADGQTIERLDFGLPRGGVITGRVLDEFGDPLPDVQVAALRSQMIGGVRRLLNSGRTSGTNDIGEFRIFGLPPGEYYVSATVRNQNAFGDSDDRAGYAPTYYPGTADVSVAQKLVIDSGQTISDITVPLSPTRTSRISGTAVDSQNHPLRGIVQALARGLNVGPLQVLPGQIRPDGSFTINGVTPGDYSLEVPPQGGPNGGASEPEYASADVTVTDGSDIAGVRLVSARASTVTGRVVIGAVDAGAVPPSSLRVNATPFNPGGIVLGPSPQPVAMNDDWTFQAKARPGVTRVAIMGLQQPWNVKAVRYRGTDVTDTGIEVKASEDLSDVEIELTNRITQLSGLVTSSRGDAVGDAWVAVFPRDREKWKPPSRSVRSSRAGQDGQFRMSGLPPGDYFAVAAESLDPNDVTDPDVLDRLQARAVRFSIGEGETKALDLKATTLP